MKLSEAVFFRYTITHDPLAECVATNLQGCGVNVLGQPNNIWVDIEDGPVEIYSVKGPFLSLSCPGLTGRLES
jgi:hypothetical protein